MSDQNDKVGKTEDAFLQNEFDKTGGVDCDTTYDGAAFTDLLCLTADRYNMPGPDDTQNPERCLRVDGNAFEVSITVWDGWDKAAFSFGLEQADRIIAILSDWRAKAKVFRSDT